MRSKLTKFLTLFSLICFTVASSQAQHCIRTNINGQTIDLACPRTCTNLTFQVPHIKSSDDYIVTGMHYDPYPYVTATGTEVTSIYIDDLFSSTIPISFPFCFFGTTYNNLVIGSNGVMTFDVTNADKENAWPLTTIAHGTIPQPIPFNGGTQNDRDITYYPRAAIMGVYHDIFPVLSGSGPRKIEYRVEGTAPCRKFIISFYEVSMYLIACNSLLSSTQIVLYEGTGVIDVNIGNKPVCSDWNQGLAILGIQNWNRDKAVTPPGKNATVWNEHDTAYQFIPSAGTSKYVASELYTLGGAFIMNADTATTIPGLLDIKFPNVCAPLGSTKFVVKTIFSACDNAVAQLVSYDTVTLNRTNNLNATFVATNTDCGPPNGTIKVTIPPGVGTAPFTYVMDAGAPLVGGNPYTIMNVPQGPHTVVVTDASGSCTSTLDVSITRNNSLTTDIEKTPTACAAVATGTIKVTATNGTGPYIFKLDGFAGIPAANPHTFTGLNSGNHTIVVFDVTGCQTNIIDVDIPVGPGVTGTANPFASSCPSVANGSITATATVGVAPFTWQLDAGPTLNGTSPFTFSNVASGPHTVTIRDALGCSGTIDVTVTAGAGVDGSSSFVPASCQGVSNGSITATAIGGIGPYKWQLDGGPFVNGANPFTFNGVAAGMHFVVIKDNIGCTKTLTIDVGSGPGLTANATPTATNCNGAANGTITITPNNGSGPYRFSLDGAPTVTGPIPYTFINLSVGPHTIVVTDGPGCISSPIAVTVPTGPELTTTVNKTDVLCNGAATGVITVTQPALGAAPFQYSLDGTVWQNSNIFNGVVAGTYPVFYRSSNGCQGSQMITITEPTALVANTSMIPVVCHGQSNGMVTVNPGGGVGPYEFSINGGSSWQTSNTFSLAAGNYTVSIRDANSCIITRPVEVTEPATLTAGYTTSNASCDGGSDGTITVNATGGNPNYTYSTDGLSFQGSNVFNVGPGTYTITVKDVLGCVTSFDVTVGLTVNLFLTPISDKPICDGTSVQLNAVSNATIYSWTPSTNLSNPMIPNPTADPRITTEYHLAATLGRCTTYDTVIVHVNAAPIPAAGQDGDICYGQHYTLQGSGGSQYIWTPAIYLDDPLVMNPVSTPSKTTIYSLSVIDAIGCHSLVTDEVKVVVSKPIRINMYPFDTVVHAGDQFHLLAVSEGISYTWTPTTGLSDPNIPDPIVTVGNTGDEMMYQVTAITEEGCKGEGYVKIKVYKGPEIYVPTGFTPNNDGKNDKFTPFPVGIRSYNYFRVFNRWGQLVFATTRLNDGWDGKLDGKEQPTGAYVWMIEGISKDNKVITQKGTVTLIR